MTSSALDSESPGSATPQSWFILHRKTLLFAALGLALFLAGFIFVSVRGNAVRGAGEMAATAAGMLAIIAATAVGIERIIETFWSLVGQLANGWWPFNKMFAEVTKLESEVKDQLKAVQDEITDKLTTAGNLTTAARQRLDGAQKQMIELNRRLAELEKLAPGNQRVSLIAASVSQTMGMITQYQPALTFNLGLVDQSVAGLTDFVASFKENPARRIINLWAGAMIGLAIAYFMRLDVFFAVLGETVRPQGWPFLGVALTGLIIGLGSNPTHDVIAALQEVKKYRATQNQPGPISEEEAVTGGEAVAGGVALEPGASFSVEETPAASRTPPPPIRRFR